MAASSPQQVLEKLVQRLAKVRQCNGFASDAGLHIFKGREDIWGEFETYPCITVLSGEQTTQQQVGHKVRVFGDFIVVGLTESDPQCPLEAGHALEGDLMRALFPEAAAVTGNDRLDGAATNVFYDGGLVAPREDGGRTTAAVINLRVEYTRHLFNPTP